MAAERGSPPSAALKMAARKPGGRPECACAGPSAVKFLAGGAGGGGAEGSEQEAEGGSEPRPRPRCPARDPACCGGRRRARPPAGAERTG